ncbi:putative sodium/sulfate symporter [Medicago truncatula]|uniref:Putative sodium/sulfate symporter n=2 Tax=Medicago truncatula TaxID=3880 RepID=A0A396I8M2_MEDTR|nr:putative sodium/sulfate symporter [Medicago truncatula]
MFHPSVTNSFSNSSPDAPKLAREKMGPMTTNEKIMTATLFLTVGLWVFGGLLNIDAVTAAILGLAVLLISGVVTWKECLAEGVAWDTHVVCCPHCNGWVLEQIWSHLLVQSNCSQVCWWIGSLSWQLSFGIL